MLCLYMAIIEKIKEANYRSLDVIRKRLRRSKSRSRKMKIKPPKPDQPDLTGSQSSAILGTAPAVDIDSEGYSKEVIKSKPRAMAIQLK